MDSEKGLQPKAEKIFCGTAAARAGLKWQLRPAEKADKKSASEKIQAFQTGI